MKGAATELTVLAVIAAVSCAQALTPDDSDLDLLFPDNFMFSSATASYQIEGAWNVSGKGENIWDRTTHEHPEKILDHSSGDVACDSYHKYKEDIKLAKSLGTPMYRFSLSWSRILPSGAVDRINDDGIRYYNAVTLFHWDLPQPLQDLGGFSNELIADYFEDYADVVYKNFGEKVKWWITLNEPYTLCQEGYGNGAKAPLVVAEGRANYLCGHTMLKEGRHIRKLLLLLAKRPEQREGRGGIRPFPELCAWLVVPKGMRRVLNWIKREYNNPQVFITENGNRFGLFHVDFKNPDRPRTPKMSSEFYKRLVATKKIPDESDIPWPDDDDTTSASSSVTATGFSVALECQEYAKYVFSEVSSDLLFAAPERVDQCAAARDTFIIGGVKAKAMEFPHMARWVLLGELDRTDSKADGWRQLVAVSETIAYPQYRPPSTYHDIALLRLARPATLSGRVRPACLQTERALRPGDDGNDVAPVATGWGLTAWEGDPSPFLQKVSLRLVSDDTCTWNYEDTSKSRLQHGIREDIQLCAGGTNKDTCQGDSGGPLQVSTRNFSRSSDEPYCMYNVIGVTSFGKACGLSFPGVYTRVSYYVPWIEKVVWPNE
ncbi:hypothetical protein FOCC_FOCC015462 [Frankliniella occidentalis]|nr:hypothetical protein FOCC_FOCC015462 [Frankliniella occidentalis]